MVLHYIPDRSSLQHHTLCAPVTQLLAKSYNLLWHCGPPLEYFEARLFSTAAPPSLVGALEVIQRAGFTHQNSVLQSNYSRQVHTPLSDAYLKQQTSYYCLLPYFLQKIADDNDGATVCLQTDDNGYFYRSFFCFPGAALFFEKCCLNSLHVDGMFYTIPLYDGILIIIVGRTSNGGMLLLAASWISSEDSQHLVFIMLMLLKAGFQITSILFWADRGNMTAAASVLHARYGITISLVLLGACDSECGCQVQDKKRGPVNSPEYSHLNAGCAVFRQIQKFRDAFTLGIWWRRWG
jgi:hypothetical protein